MAIEKKTGENSTTAAKMAEHVLVVPRMTLSPLLTDTGISKLPESSIKVLIENNARFIPRSQAEEDFEFKQIIPYLVFCYADRVFLMERSAQSTEQRLACKLSLGIGGHLNAKDLQGQTMFGWAKREFLEEVSFNGSLKQQFIGLINDDSNPVGQVHAGLFWLIFAEHDNISIKEELLSGQMVTLDYCKKHYQQLDSWSQLILDFLIDNQLLQK